MKFKSK